MSKRSLIVASCCMMFPAWSMIVKAVTAQDAATGRNAGTHDPDHSSQPTGWCVLHVDKRELVQALSDCSYALSLDPNDVQALTSRSSVYLFSNDPKAAIDDLERAILLRPDIASLHLYRGVAHSELGLSEKAISDFSQAILLRPDLVMALHNRGYEFEKLGDVKRAVADYEAALRLAPGLERSLKRLEGLRRHL